MQLSPCQSGARRWSMTSAVLTIRHGAVQVLVMNNPAARNAITAGLHASLPAALAEAQSDPRIGAIVLTGADGFFCSGGDLRVLGERRDMAPAPRREIGRAPWRGR